MIQIERTHNNTVYFSNGERVRWKENGAEIKATFIGSSSVKVTEYYNNFFEFCKDLSNILTNLNN